MTLSSLKGGPRPIISPSLIKREKGARGREQYDLGLEKVVLSRPLKQCPCCARPPIMWRNFVKIYSEKTSMIWIECSYCGIQTRKYREHRTAYGEDASENGATMPALIFIWNSRFTTPNDLLVGER